MLEFRRATESEMEEIFRLRYEVYCLEKKFLPAEDYPNCLEFDEYDQHSVHFIAVEKHDEKERILGTIRLILRNQAGLLPVEKHFKLFAPVGESSLTVEMSRLVTSRLAREYSMEILMGLANEVYGFVSGECINDLYAVLEASLLRMLKALGFPFKTAGDAAWYMAGFNKEPTTPVFLSVREVLESLPKKNFMNYFEQEVISTESLAPAS
jgi:N-acyl-L-homoserine lactone synthetase